MHSNSALSGNAYTDDDERFQPLSDGINARIRTAVYLPKLKEICFFGWDEKDDDEETMMRSFFDKADTNNDDQLEMAEIRVVLEGIGFHLSEEQFHVVWTDLDRFHNGHVSFQEFCWWWFLTKYGVPRISSGARCPMPFLENLAGFLQPRPFAPVRNARRSNFGLLL